MENLLPISALSNRSKGKQVPTEWMPDNIKPLPVCELPFTYTIVGSDFADGSITVFSCIGRKADKSKKQDF